MTTKIVPDPEDFAAVADPTLPRAERYRRAQVHKLVRLYQAGQMPVELMKELERIRARKEGAP